MPRVAIYTSWSGTQEIGWVRFTFDKFGIPFDLIYKERVKKGNLKNDYDVIVMPTQNADRAAVFAPPAARPVPYKKTDKYKFLGMYGETDDITGGMGAEGVEAFQRFLDGGGTLVTMGERGAVPDRARDGADRGRIRQHVVELLRAAADRQCRGAAARSPGLLRLHRQDHADQVLSAAR